MTRDELFAEVRHYLGVVPSWLEAMPEHEAGEVWAAIRNLLVEGVGLSARDKALVCLAVGIALDCQPMASLGSALARGQSVSPSEVLEARRVTEAVGELRRYFGADGSFDGYRFEQDMLHMAAAMRTAMNIA